MYCENCGAYIPEDSNFCPECGTAVMSEPEPVSVFCPNCGKELEPDSLFCENCGHKLSSKQSVYKADVPSAPAGPRASSIPPAPLVSPARPHEKSIPSAPQPEVRKPVQPKETKPKKKSGFGTVVLILFVLLALAAGYYFLMVYEGDPNSQIGRVISGIKPGAESAAATVETVLTKLPETISDITSKPTAASKPANIQPAATAAPVTWPTASISKPTAVVPQVNAPTATTKQKEITSYYAGDYSTTESSRLSDFLWLTQDIVHGSLPAGIDRLTSFDQLLGGWKAYIIDDLNGQYGSGIEHLCQVNFWKDTGGNAMTFQWSYVHNTKTDEGNTDNTPPTTFYGEMQDGRFHGLGIGSIDMTDFYVLNGHEYAVGVLHWPDTAKGTVFLVRP